MVRITEAVKRSREKKSFPKPENKKEESKPSIVTMTPSTVRVSELFKEKKEELKPSIVTMTPSTVRVSELFKEKKVVVEDREVYRRIYDNLVGFVKEVMESPKKNEVFEIKDAADTVERIINRLDNSDSNTFIELVLTNSTLEENYLYAHSVNVCLLALRLGKALNISKSELIDLGTGALMHDIGMLKVPQEIVKKPTCLTDNERDIIKTHPSEGHKWLEENVKGLKKSIFHIVFQHHEKANGQGYPQRLTKEQIHKFAQIIRLVDSYEAMTHPRSWRKPFLPVEAIREILDDEKDFYEDSLIRLLLREISIYPIGSWVELNTKEIGKVAKVDPRAPLRPTVEIIFDPDRFKLEKPKLTNLIEHPLIYIEKACEAKG